MMSLREAASRLGGDISGNTVTCPGPGHKRGDRSLSVSFDASAPDGFLCHSFADDDWRECRDHVRDLLGLGRFKAGEPKEYRPREPRPPSSWRDDPKAVSSHEKAGELWLASRPIGGTVAATYLTARHITLTDEAFTGAALRFHPACPFRLESGEWIRLPAMVAAMVDVQTNEFRGIHRTALKEDGSGKADVRGLGNPKRMLGPAAGACVKISPDEDVTYGLALVEGLETGLALRGIGIAPIWAALSTSGISSFPVLGGVDTLTIYGDHDANGAGERAADKCGTRWAEAGQECILRLSPVVGEDFNDLIERAAA